MVSSDIKNSIGINNTTISNLKNNIGSINSDSSEIKNNIGISNVTIPDVKNNIGESNPDSSNIKNNMGVKPVNDTLLFNQLYRKMGTCSHTSIWNAVKILKQLGTNSSRQSHKQFCAITGLSASGMAKHIRMLKKRQFIHRTGFQQYTLTQTALDMLQHAMK